MQVISIDHKSHTPIYKQIIYSICNNIDNGLLKQGDAIPSVNNVASEFSLARGSVFTAYNELKSLGIIKSISGKGYFVSSTKTQMHHNIFLLFTTFSTYKERLYGALTNSLKGRCNVDIYFHHYNINIFEQLINQYADQYNSFIIMPMSDERVPGILSVLNPQSTYLLDLGYKEYGDSYAGVYQNFENDIYRILKKKIALIKKYKRLILVHNNNFRSREIITGFERFAAESPVETMTVIADKLKDIRKHDAYITIEDSELVTLIHTAKKNKWTLGRDLGILSYNETALKSIISDGISTITTDFNLMGKQMAEMILNREQKTIENKFVMIDRKSF